uniref:Viral T-cell receptor beta chain-like T17T-22 n=1 Tax=Feline leukemia virus TaxID=11768 RepID=TCB_FLV|nr:RecName: Full=Viral T-cell receptor beta chain-like T17T-22; Flags: Precursor [Feline leukemia virus]CAA28801.1 TCR beta (VDJC) [Feline leukemia virus]
MISWLPSVAMGSRLLCCVALCLLGAGPADSGLTQTPRHLVKARGQQVTLSCFPISGHLSLYWYQQAVGQGPQLLIQYYNREERGKGNFPERFSAQQFPDSHSELNMTSLELTDSALYLCASSPNEDSEYGETLYFGEGSRLTVVEDLKKVSPPKVTVFEPSEAEISRTLKATLVCLATGFYPDHVELSWWVNGKEVRDGVSTDPEPYKEQSGANVSSYCLSSRLRVSATFWHNPRNHFRCQVQFHGLGKDDQWDYPEAKPVTQNVSADTWGRADCGFTSASYQQGVLSATILYEILLGKATLYAILVSVLALMAKVKRKDS